MLKRFNITLYFLFSWPLGLDMKWNSPTQFTLSINPASINSNLSLTLNWAWNLCLWCYPTTHVHDIKTRCWQFQSRKTSKVEDKFHAYSEIIDIRTCIYILTNVILLSDSWTEIHNILQVEYYRHLLSCLKVCKIPSFFSGGLSMMSHTILIL